MTAQAQTIKAPLLALSYLPANGAYAFTFGDSLARMGNNPMFYQSRVAAIAAAASRNLAVGRYGVVSIIRS